MTVPSYQEAENYQCLERELYARTQTAHEIKTIDALSRVTAII
jgi:hypothetical protein